MGDPAELAALYASGALPAADCDAFERHLREGCDACVAELRQLDDVVSALAEAPGSDEPAPAIRARLLLRAADDAKSAGAPRPADPRVWHQWQPDSIGSELFVQRAADGVWENTGVDGVLVRRLFVDHDRNQFTALIRMAPGASYPRHIHNGPEECLVLEGELHVGDDVLRAGDYQRAPAGSRHAVQRTEGGCLLLINSSLTDELI
jgi:anti-sigma factor ChrR (cupin superfamily)